ncbi:ATP-synt_Fo_b domain containing protein [Candidatus Nanopelagicaceae bacterium]
MKVSLHLKSFFLILGLLMSSQTAASSASDVTDYGSTDGMAFFFDPDPKSGETYFDVISRKQYRYIYKEVTISDSVNSTYFMINGLNGDPRFPDFYGGVQQLGDGSRIALFSTWDLGTSNCDYFSCKPEDAEQKNKISLFAKGARATGQRYGGEGTGMTSRINDLNWKVGQKISWLVSLEPAGADSLLSVAIKLEGEPWEFFASHLIPTRYKYGLGGGYGFIEDFGFPTPFSKRSMAIGPTIGETPDGVTDYFTNVYVGSGGAIKNKKNRHKVTVVGPTILGEVGIAPQSDAEENYRLRLGIPSAKPDYIEGKLLLEMVTSEKSTRYQEEIQKLEADKKAKTEADAKAAAELKAKQEAEAKVAAELKAKQEAEAKVAAELKAKQEAEAKVAAELKAKQEAEAKVAADKAAAELKAKQEAEAKATAELKAKQEAEAKIAADKASGEKIIADAKDEAARILAAAKAAAAKKKTTITCVKGKLTKKVTAVKPLCPKGYKKK